jgi:acetyltransferase-like isoleucine patch superfamily enzyme
LSWWRRFQAQEPQALSPLIDYRGRHSYGLGNFVLHSWDDSTRLHIGSFCSIARNVQVLLGGEHRTDWLTTYPFGHIHSSTFPNGAVHGRSGHPASRGDVTVSDDVWVGRDAILLSGTTLAEGVVLGAGSVIKGLTKPYGIYAGNPARLVRMRFEDEIIELLLRLRWWDLDDQGVDAIIPILQQPPDASILASIVRDVRG